jgi:hypothetical protein
MLPGIFSPAVPRRTLQHIEASERSVLKARQNMQSWPSTYAESNRSYDGLAWSSRLHANRLRTRGGVSAWLAEAGFAVPDQWLAMRRSWSDQQGLGRFRWTVQREIRLYPKQ